MMFEGLLGPAWVEVNLDHIAYNVRQIKRCLSARCTLMAVVKEDAYGHGCYEVAMTALRHGAGYLGVSSLAEGLELRARGIEAPILVFTPLVADEVDTALRARLTLTVVDVAGARRISDAALALGVRQTVHVKVDTGMGRYGFWWQDVLPAVEQLSRLEGIDLEGIYTHLAQGYRGRAGNGSCQVQADRFMNGLEELERAGYTFKLRHIANSGATLELPHLHLDMVRCGNLIYGITPPGSGSSSLPLKEAWRFRSRITQVRELPAGAHVGYGRGVRLKRPLRTAVVPVGYGDGIGLSIVHGGTRLMPRLAEWAKTWLKMVLHRLGLAQGLSLAVSPIRYEGQSLPIVGKLSMQQAVVALGDIEVETGAIVDVTARRTAVNPRLTRLFLRNGRPFSLRTPLGSYYIKDEEKGVLVPFGHTDLSENEMAVPWPGQAAR